MPAGKDNLSEPVKNEPHESKHAITLESNLADTTAKIFLVMNASYTIEGKRYSIIFMLHLLHVRHSIPCIGVYTYKGK